jgi:tether containing UBX domain for GLUT4
VRLSPGAKLDLVVKSKSPSAVTVALRLPESETKLGIPNNRVSEKFRSDTTLWKVLRQLEETGAGKQRGLNLTARGIPKAANGAQTGSGQLYWEAPVLKVAGRELSTLQDFQKTLSQVGIEAGSQLVLLDFRVTDLTLQAAMENAHSYFAEVEPDTAKSTEAPAAQTAKPTEVFPNPQAERKTLASQENTSPEPVLPGPSSSSMETDDSPLSRSAPTDPLKPLEVWSPANSATPIAARRNDSEADFTPSVAQMKAHQEFLKAGTHNSRLKSDAELAADAAAAEAKLAAVERVEVRVRFPDGHIVKWAFGTDATGATLHAAVRGVLVQERSFKLMLPMGQGELADEDARAHRLIRGYGLKGGVVVSLVVLGEEGSSNIRAQKFLADGVLQQAHEVVVPALPQGSAEEDVPAPMQVEKPAAEGKEKKGGGMPKWLKLGKK